MTTMTTHSSDSPTTFLKVLTFIALIGAINWGLIGFFNWNLVDAIFGGGTQETTSSASRVVYALVGISGLLAMLLLLMRGNQVANTTR